MRHRQQQFDPFQVAEHIFGDTPHGGVPQPEFGAIPPGYGPTPPLPGQPVEENRGTGGLGRWIAAWSGIVAGTFFVGSGLGGLLTPWWVWLVVGAIVGLAGGYEALTSWRTVAGRGSWSVPAVGIFLTLCVALGTLTTPVIDGAPRFLFSDSAKAQIAVDVIASHLEGVQQLDELLALDRTQGRLRQRELEAIHNRIEQWFVDYSTHKVPGGPGRGELFEAAKIATEHTLAAAIEAATAQREWLITGDPVKREEAEQWRAAYMTGLMEAAAQLTDAAAVYGIVIGEDETGVVE